MGCTSLTSYYYLSFYLVSTVNKKRSDPDLATVPKSDEEREASHLDIYYFAPAAPASVLVK